MAGSLIGFPCRDLLRSGVTTECLKTIGKLSKESERFVIIVITGTMAEMSQRLMVCELWLVMIDARLFSRSESVEL